VDTFKPSTCGNLDVTSRLVGATGHRWFGIVADQRDIGALSQAAHCRPSATSGAIPLDASWSRVDLAVSFQEGLYPLHGTALPLGAWRARADA